MSLLAWYPFNGDVSDHSGNGLELTQSVAPVYSTGKIGQSLSTGAFTWTADTTAKILNNNALTIALWLYVGGTQGSTTERTMIFGNDGMGDTINNRKFSLFQYPTCNDLHYSWQNNVANATFASGVISNAFPSGQWTHLCLTYQNPVCNIYINGTLNRTFSATSDSSTFSNITKVIYDSVYHKINDLRFYDHALSIKEVYDLSKAKILHYKFDDCQEPTINIVSNGTVDTLSGWAVSVNTGVGDSESVTLIDGDGVAGQTCAEFNVITKTSWSYYNYNLYNDVAPGFFNMAEKYTLSFWGKRVAGSYSGSVSIRDGNSTNIVSTTYYYTLTDTWKRYSFTFTPLCVGNSPVVFFDSAQGTIRRIDGLQLEQKDHMTDFVKGSRTGTIHDCSGHDNNADNPTNISPNWLTDGRIGNGAYLFDGTKYIQFSNPFKSANTVSQMTLCGWIYKTANSSSGNHLISLCGNYFARIALDKSSIGIWAYLYYYNGTSYSNIGIGYGSVNDFAINTWYHIAFTFDYGIVKLYVNGVLSHTQDCSATTTSLYSGGSTGYVGAYQSNAEMLFGKADDVRIYATALDGADILDLYRTRASIDNAGNLFTSGMTENFITTSNSINSKGSTISKKFSEVGVTDGLVAWYPLNGNLLDKSGNQNHCSMTGAPTAVIGLNQFCYKFPGIDNNNLYSACDYNVMRKNYETASWTFSAWVKVDSDHTQGEAIVLGRVGCHSGLMASDTTLYFRVWGDTHSPSIHYTIPDNNAWYHVVGTYANRDMTFYINGTVIGTAHFSDTALFQSFGSNLYIGGYSTYEFKGSVQEARVYNKALTSEEVSILYDLKKSNKVSMKMTQDAVYVSGVFKEV